MYQKCKCDPIMMKDKVLNLMKTLKIKYKEIKFLL
jgi:hypothetical protein